MKHSGIEVDERDPKVTPAQDLYRHINGKWLERTVIPADRARYGSFHKLVEAAEEAVRDIATECQGAADGTSARKIGDLYQSFMDEEAVEKRGNAPLEPLFHRIDRAASISDLMHALGEFERKGCGSFVSMFVDNDPGDPTRYVVFLEQAGIGLPDESYFREDKFADIRVAYLKHIEKMFTLAGLSDAGKRAERVFGLEERLAGFHWDAVKCRDTHATYNLVPWEEFALSLGPIAHPWRKGLAVQETTLSEVVVRQPSFIEGARIILESAELGDVADWLRWRVVHGLAPYLTKAMVDENFDFYGKTISGTPELRARWKRGVTFIEGGLGEAIGELYVAKHFPPTAKAQMDVLIDNLIAAYRDSITNLEWMSAETKAKALEKLDKFDPKIGYPKKWRDYSKLEVTGDDLITNVSNIAAFEFERELGKIGKPIDRDEWFMLPQTVNAYYNPGFNDIVFPAAILQYPFFVADRDPAANYGAIGGIIGHEIGHGFDDQGSEFDGDGRLSNWWTDEDRKKFEERTKRLVEQYNSLEPAVANGNKVNGELTIGENIGDLGGISIAWKAYLLSLGGDQPPVVDGMTGAERFFLSWAQSWREAAREEEAIRLLAIDPHSPPEFRCNQIVRNLGVFHETFGVKAGDPMWLPEEERVSIW